MFSKDEVVVMLRLVRARLVELHDGMHRYFLGRRNKSMNEQELLPKLRMETDILTRLRNKLWRMRSEQSRKKEEGDRKDAE